ncbi:hypothetical protein IWX87_003939 [Polaromonas sp. CG_9.7]|jgi:hypothetical protein|nr:hypothetical protein [Polaromonas sp. CG_9.7]MBG6116150.1 hypothetical protein [Polaromonas sp. CG_9.2]MDH6185102.1 hypothetical protein [Polaromonas sp. CG_23.6]
MARRKKSNASWEGVVGFISVTRQIGHLRHV